MTVSLENERVIKKRLTSTKMKYTLFSLMLFSNCNDDTLCVRDWLNLHMTKLFYKHTLYSIIQLGHCVLPNREFSSSADLIETHTFSWKAFVKD